MAICLFCEQTTDDLEGTSHPTTLLRNIAAAAGVAKKAIGSFTVCSICYCKHRNHSEFLKEAALKLREKGAGVNLNYCERDAPGLKKLQRQVDEGFRNLLIEKPDSKKE